MQRILKYKDKQLGVIHFRIPSITYYSGTPLIRSPMGQKSLAVLTGGFCLQENVWSFRREAKNESGRNITEIAVMPCSTVSCNLCGF